MIFPISIQPAYLTSLVIAKIMFTMSISPPKSQLWAFSKEIGWDKLRPRKKGSLSAKIFNIHFGP